MIHFPVCFILKGPRTFRAFWPTVDFNEFTCTSFTFPRNPHTAVDLESKKKSSRNSHMAIGTLSSLFYPCFWVFSFLRHLGWSASSLLPWWAPHRVVWALLWGQTWKYPLGTCTSRLLPRPPPPRLLTPRLWGLEARPPGDRI